MRLEYLSQEWKIIFFGVLIVVLITIVVRMVGLVKTLKFYHNFPGSSDRSYLFGHMHQLLGDGETFMDFFRKKMDEGNGKFVSLWLNPLNPDIFVYHPEVVKKVLTSSAPKSHRYGSPYSLLMPWIGEGLIAANGQKWARSRKLLTPAFHFDILRDYIDIYHDATDTLLKSLDNFAVSGESFDICPLLHSCTLESILRCCLGFEANKVEKSHPYAHATKVLTDSLYDRARKPWLWPDFLYRMSTGGKAFFKQCDYVHRIAEEIIAKRKTDLQNGKRRSKGRHMDFIDVLLSAKDEDGKGMTTMEIRNQVDSFMFAGHDTSATSVSWILYTLAKHEDYQERVQEEIDGLLEGHDNPNIVWQDLTKLEMLSQCMKETMRLYPPIPFIQRVLDVGADFDGWKITAGTTVTVAIANLHRNALIWDDPDEFYPERFHPKERAGKDNFSFIPFSVGARNCIGQNFAYNEMKVMLTRILQRYKVSIAPDGKPPQRLPAGVLKSETGIWLKVQRR